MNRDKIKSKKLPEGWSLTILENLLDYIQPTNYIVSSIDYNDKYKTPVLTAGKSFILGYTNEVEGIFDRLPVIIFDDFTTAIKWVNFPFKVKSSAMKILVPTHIDVNMKFVYYFMETLCINTDTHKRYWISVGAKSPIPLAPLNEQNRIVLKLDELFSELEKGKEQLQTSLEQLKVYRQSILKHAFEGKLSENWRKLNNAEKFKQYIEVFLNQRLDAYNFKITEAKKNRRPKPRIPKNLDKKFKLNEDLLRFISPKIPESWRVVHLAVISNDEPDSIVDGPFGSSINVQEDYKESGVPVIRINNILPFEFSRNKLKFIRDEKFETLKRHNVLPGDVLFGKVGTIGNSCIYPDREPEGMLSTTGSCRIRVDEKIVTKEYLCYYLNSQKTAFNEIASAAVQAFLNMETINNFPIPICSIEEQEVIVEELEKEFTICDYLENTLIENIQLSENLKQSILQKAFEGNLVKQDPNDAPASVLLERIKKEREAFWKAKRERKESEKPLTKKKRNMAEELKRIMDILKESEEPVSAKLLWQSSTHKDDIDEFYAALKSHIEAGEIIELPRQGKESYLKLAETK